MSNYLLSNGDTAVQVHTVNPSVDDNIFFAAFDVKSALGSVDSGAQGPNLVLSKQGPPSKDRGSLITYNLHYHNLGDTSAQNVVLEDTLSGLVVFESASNGGSYDENTRTVSWNLGALPIFSHGTVSVTVRIPADVAIGTLIPNEAQISTPDTETRYDDNVANTQTGVTGSNLPAGASVGPTNGGTTPSVHWRTPITFSYTAPDSLSGVDIRIHINDGGPDIVASMTGGPLDWTYTTTFYPRHGTTTVTYTPHLADCSEIAWGAKVSAAFITKVLEISQRLGVDPNYLMAVMAFETGETFSPSATNPTDPTDPLSGAVGLIQFTQVAIDDLNRVYNLQLTKEELFQMTDIEQLDFVERFFQIQINTHGSLFTLEDTYMAVLYPIAIGQPNDSVLFSDPSVEYQRNQGLDLDDDGHVTKAEASQKVRERLDKGNRSENSAPCVAPVDFGIYIDPAGYIYDIVTGDRIAGATVWLQRPDGSGNWENVPTGLNPPVSQPDVNPLITGSDGQYQWDVLAGSYRVHVEAPGYFPADSPVVSIPPPVTDLHVGLIPIQVPNMAPVADANGPYVGGKNTPITIDASASFDPDSGDTLTYSFDCSNDGAFEVVDQASSVFDCTYSDAGTFTARVQVKDDEGLTDEATSSVTVTNDPPVADANGPYTGTAGVPITFDGSASFDPDGTIVQYEWDFEGDGVFDSVSADPTATHTYAAPFVGSAELRATDDSGEAATDTASVEVVAAGCPDDVLISNYQTDPANDQFVEVANVGDGPINLSGCSLVTFDVFTETSIGDATVGLSGTLTPGQTVRVNFAGQLPPGPGAIGIYNIAPPPDGTPFSTENEITGMVYLDNDTVFAIGHLTKPEHNSIYQCIYGGSGQGQFDGPFPKNSDCLPQ